MQLTNYEISVKIRFYLKRETVFMFLLFLEHVQVMTKQFIVVQDVMKKDRFNISSFKGNRM